MRSVFPSNQSGLSYILLDLCVSSFDQCTCYHMLWRMSIFIQLSQDPKATLDILAAAVWHPFRPLLRAEIFGVVSPASNAPQQHCADQTCACKALSLASMRFATAVCEPWCRAELLFTVLTLLRPPVLPSFLVLDMPRLVGALFARPNNGLRQAGQVCA